jgi:FtsP/CotA-like multicopper oxidase with cupredoxin domain
MKGFHFGFSRLNAFHPRERRGRTSKPCLLLLLLFAICFVPEAALAQSIDEDACARPLVGGMVPEPADLRSENGVLKVELTFTNYRDAAGQVRYCYRDKNGNQAPNLRVHPGDWLIVTLKNLLHALSNSPHDHSTDTDGPTPGRCGSGIMDGLSTNLHFHGLIIPPVCHQDDVLNTLISPSEPAFEYRFQIPPDQPPGLYWYHPHVHGSSNKQVQGGASGALIVEGIERANPLVAGLPERVLIVRDQDLINPDAPASPMSIMPQMPALRDGDGDILNTGTGTGKPSKDLSLNFVAVPYPDYSPALILMQPSERQIWRVLNASAITYLDLQVLFNEVPQPLGEVSLDGVPVNYADKYSANARPGLAKLDKNADKNRVVWVKHIELPPGARVDFIFTGPPEGLYGNLITRAVDTGSAGENDPVRPLANIIAKTGSPEPRSTLPAFQSSLISPTTDWIGNAKPNRTRKLYFSERPSDPNNPNSPTVFMITVDGQQPAPYSPQSITSNITAHQGDVEDWIIENRSPELHAFHIHQIHFLLEELNGVPVDEPFLRDVVNIPFWNGSSTTYPSVKLRMDFRNPGIAGTFVYHCHLLEHEDGGMMGTITVKP